MVGTKRLGDVLSGVELVQQCHRNSLAERPAQQRVEVSAAYDEEQRQVRRLASCVTVEVNTSEHLVTYNQ